MEMVGLTTTLIAAALDIERDGLGPEALRQFRSARRDVIQTVDFTAFVTFEMRVAVATVGRVDLKAPGTVVAGDLVHDIVGQQPVEHAVERDAVEIVRDGERVEQFLMAQWVM